MKNIFIALMVTALAFTGAQAQTKKTACASKNSHLIAAVHTKRTSSCGRQSDAVCRRTHGGTHCYKTKYATNFKVCKNENGYYICCEKPNWTNSTAPRTIVSRETTTTIPYVMRSTTPVPYRYAEVDAAYREDAIVSRGVPITAPQSQSYPWGTTQQAGASSATSYMGYYPRKGKIKVCYYGDNVAELNRAPYQGCDAPAFDGIEKNKVHNLNVSNTRDLPPIDGRID
jgi:hypothetical protein